MSDGSVEQQGREAMRRLGLPEGLIDDLMNLAQERGRQLRAKHEAEGRLSPPRSDHPDDEQLPGSAR
jgi:hypothetical protein